MIGAVEQSVVLQYAVGIGGVLVLGALWCAVLRCHALDAARREAASIGPLHNGTPEHPASADRATGDAPCAGLCTARCGTDTLSESRHPAARAQPFRTHEESSA